MSLDWHFGSAKEVQTSNIIALMHAGKIKIMGMTVGEMSVPRLAQRLGRTGGAAFVDDNLRRFHVCAYSYPPLHKIITGAPLSSSERS